MGKRNRWAVVATAALLTAVLTAPAEAAAGPTASAAPASAAPTTAAGTDLPDGALQVCPTTQLAADIQMLNPGAGQRYAAVSLTNTSARPCYLLGYPGLQLRTAAGPAPMTVYWVPDPRPPQVTLAPGQAGWARLHWAVVASDCVLEVTSVRITPPAQTHFLTVPGLGRVCEHGRVDVTALSPNPPES